jgi:hypothetical protein
MYVTKDVSIIKYLIFLEFICFTFLFQINQGGDGGYFIMGIQRCGGRFIRRRDLEPERHYLIIYVWTAGPRARTLVRLWPGDDLWMFLYQWRFYINEVETHLNECQCFDLPMGSPVDLEVVRWFGSGGVGGVVGCFFN